MSDESDDELLANLLSTANGDDAAPSEEPIVDLLSAINDNDNAESQEPQTNPLSAANDNNVKPEGSEQTKPKVLKELEHDIFEDLSEFFTDDIPGPELPKQSSKINKGSVSIYDNNEDSSDEEDRKYFHEQRYSNYGRGIKRMLKNKKESQYKDFQYKITFKKEDILKSCRSNDDSSASSSNIESNADSPSQRKAFNSSVHTPDKHSLHASVSSPKPVKKDVYSDPVFGLRMIKPLVSSTELVERMQGRKAVKVSTIKLHLANQALASQPEDWVIAGVIMSKTASKTSQKGNTYSIWRITDLATEMKTVSVFLFKNAHEKYWKTSIGAVIGILNPSVMDSRDDKDLATLSVDNWQKIMLLGTSKDLGTCKSKKKDGEPCTAPVNLSSCEYCVFHVKQEYGKFANRSELVTNAARRSFGSTIKDPYRKMGVSSQRHPDAEPFTAIRAVKDSATVKKDRERLALLRGETKFIEKPKVQPKSAVESTKLKATSVVDLSTSQLKKDTERLNKLKELNPNSQALSPSIKEEKMSEMKFSLPAPKLAAGIRGGVIDFTEPISKYSVNKAKVTAIELAKKLGGFKKTNPNKVRPSKEVMSEKGVKRRRDEEEGEEIAQQFEETKIVKKNKFQEMLEKTSAHSDLIEKREDEEQENYFNKLEVKERMEEKMLTTHQAETKAVTCRICKYVAFSSSEFCKQNQHPIKVINTFKRYFKCGDCGYRTIALDRIPTETCKRCASSKWVKSTMMDEKKTQIKTGQLCIRGGEEKYIGSIATDANLDMLVPESD